MHENIAPGVAKRANGQANRADGAGQIANPAVLDGHAMMLHKPADERLIVRIRLGAIVECVLLEASLAQVAQK